jgi:hypothetical protein
LLSFEGLFFYPALLTFDSLFVGFCVHIKGNNKGVTTKQYMVVYGMQQI